MQLCSAGKIGLMYAGRAFTGLGVGSSSLVVPQYIAECSPPPIRGGLVGLFEICLQLGTVVGFWINYGVNENISSNSRSQWMIPVGVQFGPAILLIIGMFFVVDSPRWSIKNGLCDQATKDLMWLRQLPADHPYIVREISDIQQQLEHEQELAAGGSGLKSMFKEAFNKQTLPRLLAGCTIQVLQNTTGINAINYVGVTSARNF
jgi:MFS family permease